MIDLIKFLRKLAKSDYWQTLFAASKQISGIYLFENTRDFSPLQINFINWLAYYNSLNYYLEDGSLPEWAYDNDLYIDALLYYLKKEKKNINTGVQQSKDITKEGSKLQGLKIVFKSKE